MQIILAIAAICQMNSGLNGTYRGTLRKVDEHQKVCQQQLAKCAIDKKINTPDTLRDIEQMLICVRDRK